VIAREAIGVEVDAETSSSPLLTASQPADAHALDVADTARTPPANSANAARLIAATRPTPAIPHLSPSSAANRAAEVPVDVWQIGGMPSSHSAQTAYKGVKKRNLPALVAGRSQLDAGKISR
jgi:hypothetical protein